MHLAVHLAAIIAVVSTGVVYGMARTCSARSFNVPPSPVWTTPR
jgi:hypothetical protein